MKELYISPELEILCFGVEDVVVTSGDEQDVIES